MFVRNFDNCELINLFVAILCWLHKFKCSFIFLNLSSLLIYTFTFLYFKKCFLYYESFASSAFRKLVLCILNDGFRRTAVYKKRMKKYIKLLVITFDVANFCYNMPIHNLLFQFKKHSTLYLET